MSFYRKTLLAIFLTSSLLIVLVVGGVYRTLSSSITENYQIRYHSLATTLAETIEKLENGTEDTMRAALQALRFYTADHPIPTDSRLRVMQRKLRVSNIEFIQKDGIFIRSSSQYKASEIPNLFSFCADYRKLFTGEREFDRTPLMPSSLKNQIVLKFALLPSIDRRYVINVGMTVGYIGELLRSVMASDKNIISLGLYTPNGTPLNSLIRSGKNISEDNAVSLQTSIKGTGSDRSGNINFSTPVKATVQSCCECITKKLVTDPSGKFYYILKTQVSLGDLKGSLTKLAWTMTIVAILSLIFAFILAQLVTKKLIHSERSKALGEMARDLEHNIRSPLIAAENSVPLLAGAAEGPRQVLANAVCEMRALVDKLKSQADAYRLHSTMIGTSNDPSYPLKQKEEKLSLQHIFSLIDQVISKKKIEFEKQSKLELSMLCDPENYTLFALLQPIEFKVALSNLINNAVDALSNGHGKVVVKCKLNGDRIKITINDTGLGISPELLPQLGKRGITFGKNGGSGLGLSHAKTVIEKMGGTLLITSKVGHGTEATIDLPLASPPDWFVPAIIISPETNIVVLDDNQSIHDLWEQRFKTLIPYKKMEHLFKGDELRIRKQKVTLSNSPTLYLIDYELLGEDKTGLDLIEELNLTDRSILVTGRFDEEKIIVRSRWLGVKIIPKPLAGIVPITCVIPHKL